MAAAAVVQPALHVVEPTDEFTIRLGRQPDAMLAEAQLCARALQAKVRECGWATRFSDKPDAKEHLWYEAWNLLAAMYRCTVKTREHKFVQFGDVTGFEATVDAFHIPSGRVVGTGVSMCLDDEERWSDRPVYKWQKKDGKNIRVKTDEWVAVPYFQLLSMAQTRAGSKALKGPFSWIVALAGYAPRPADEMKGTEPGENDPDPTGAPPQKTETAGGAGRLITEKQASRIWGIGHSFNVSKDAIIAILKKHGFVNASDVTADKYDAVCAAVEAAGGGK